MIQPAVIPQPTDSGPPSGQNLLLFRIYLIYRTVLSVVFLLLQMLPATRELVGAENPALYTTVTAVFLATNLLLLGAVAARWQRSNARLVLLFGVDIACITLLSDASGGMVSGLPLLLTVTVASSAVLISNRTVATLVAALAVLALLSIRCASCRRRRCRSMRCSRPACSACCSSSCPGSCRSSPCAWQGRGPRQRTRQRPLPPAAPQRADRAATCRRASCSSTRRAGRGCSTPPRDACWTRIAPSPWNRDATCGIQGSPWQRA
jgi:hypothetical protein